MRTVETALVLLSGGLDSSTALAIARQESEEVDALTFAYGQRHGKEVAAAQAVAQAWRVPHHTLAVDLTPIGGSALTDPAEPVPLERPVEAIAQEIPRTYVPARNTIFLSLALAWAETRDRDAIYIGANRIDNPGYPDCRPEFYEAFQEVARLGTKRGVSGRPTALRYPLIDLTKAQIVRRAVDLGVPLELTWSCYLGEATACGRCDACQLRLRGFQEAGVADPVPYAHVPAWYAPETPGPRTP